MLNLGFHFVNISRTLQKKFSRVLLEIIFSVESQGNSDVSLGAESLVITSPRRRFNDPIPFRFYDYTQPPRTRNAIISQIFILDKDWQSYLASTSFYLSVALPHDFVLPLALNIF